tara:strand:+ start:5500 stop:6981 length:1482 start_codon:yes stop_codon:yes gene_type:complete
MRTTVRDLIDNDELGIRLLTRGADDLEVNWSHSTDLDDPSPFLEPGQLLLTTGRQFPPGRRPHWYRDYVARLLRAGVVALGFGTEVIREGTPTELIAACQEAGLILLEIPYATPFIAVSKFIASRHAAEGRRQVEWTLAAQESIAKAVLGSHGLSAAVADARRWLKGEIAVFDSDGAILEGGASDVLSAQTLALLRRGKRARDAGTGAGAEGHWSVSTLGRSGRLLGAVAVAQATALNPGETSIVTMLTALTELSLEHAEDQRLAFRSVSLQLFGLLRDGKTETVRKALRFYPAQLPHEPFHAIVLWSAELPPPTRGRLERMATARRRLFAVKVGEKFVVLVDESSRALVEEELLFSLVRAGVSAGSLWVNLDEGLAQAAAALEAAQPGQTITFSELTSDSVFGLLMEPRVTEIARIKLSPMLKTEAGRKRVGEAAVWLRLNGAWEPAARQLQIHRHTLRDRISTLGAELGLQLDDFRGRAELWAMLAALDLA